MRDQIIEGLLDGDTVETLLQETDLTLDKIIIKCQAQEAAKKQRANMAGQYAESVSAIHKPQDRKAYASSPTCPDCGSKPHPTGSTQFPAYGQICHYCQ